MEPDVPSSREGIDPPAPPGEAGSSESLCLFGAPLDTGNLGVSALGTSVVAAVTKRRPTARVTIFDNGRGQRISRLPLGESEVELFHRGAWLSRRLHRQESLWTMSACSRIPVGALPNLRALDRARLVLDISGGDSFTDLYGQERFRMVSLPKTITLRRQRPLVLLPQTYGPFRDADNARFAGALVARTTQAWARDLESFERLEELLGSRFNAQQHLLGVDVAFALPAVPPRGPLGTVREWLEDTDHPPVGLNVSGLLANDPDGAAARFGLTADYATAAKELLHRLLERTDRRILLVAHTRGAMAESDDDACDRLLASVSDPSRVRLLPGGLGAPQLKWIIGRLEWFCGARMHATIAALSSLVPVCAVAYSDKARGVFATCSVSEAVVDARRSTTEELVEQMWRGWEEREDLRQRLRASVPAVIDRAERQFDTILHLLDDPAGAAVAT